jgi:hypothetical protein
MLFGREAQASCMYAVPAVSLILFGKRIFIALLCIADISPFTPATALFFGYKPSQVRLLSEVTI